jgi:hypothetical protein
MVRYFLSVWEALGLTPSKQGGMGEGERKPLLVIEVVYSSHVLKQKKGGDHCLDNRDNSRI